MPSTQIRQAVLTKAKRVVVKLGTQLLTDDQGHLDLRFVRQIAGQIAQLRQRGLEVTLVSSGAIGAGLAHLAMEKRPTDVAELQALAAVGQPQLMNHMTNAFAKHDLKAAQLLLTRADFDDRARFLNIRNCVSRLHAHGCIPVINENDTVAVDELRFGDNDMLAALITNAIRADAMILLTVVQGLLDAQGQLVDMVDSVKHAREMARDEKSHLGSGGMTSKLQAAALVTGAGEVAVIAHGREKDVLTRLLDGRPGLGTVFVPSNRKLDSRRRWIGLTKRPAGVLTVDPGAAKALTQRGKSLLAGGITQVTGTFERGAVLLVCDDTGEKIAQGLSNYSHTEIDLIKGKRSSQFEKILGRTAFAEVIHRDHLVLLGR